MNEEHVTFRALAEPHWRQTRARTSGHYLLLGDTTTLDFGSHRNVQGLGPVGDGGGRGFLLHSRTAEVEVRFGQVLLPAPRDCGKFVRECGIVAIAMWVVEVRQLNPPVELQPLRWVLFTSHAVESFEDAWKVIEYYEKRPLIEEFHKAAKTGCRLEARQYQTSHALEATAGMLSVIAIRLVQLKSVARVDPDRPAETVVPRRWVKMARCIQRGKHRNISSVREFYHAVARLGGWLGRKHDGEPGWITLWRGFDKLVLLLRGADASRSKCG